MHEEQNSKGMVVVIDDLNDADKIKRLLKIHEGQHVLSPERYELVKSNVKRIINEGKYDL